MRRLTQPDVLKHASVAAVITALACWPRMLLWQERTAPVWFLEIAAFLCSIVLWSFVFAWHTAYTGRPAWGPRPGPKLFLMATVGAIVADLAYHLCIDPTLRAKAPGDYPADMTHWIAMALFAVSLNQLFTVFAPFAFFIRLFRNPTAAMVLTILFSVFILTNKMSTLSSPPSGPLAVQVVVGRLITGSLAVIFYLRGGIGLATWWTLLLEVRYLPEFP
jgi:hypothetical protein